MPSAIKEQNTGRVERLDIAGSCLTGRGANFAHIVRSSLLINICSTPNPILRQRQPSEEGRFCLLLRPLWIGFDTLWTRRHGRNRLAGDGIVLFPCFAAGGTNSPMLL